MSSEVLHELIGQTCWHVSIGGVTAPSFQLAMGERVPRSTPLRNPAQGEDYRLHTGSHQLFVVSPWRLQTPDEVRASSGQDEGDLLLLRQLTGARVDEALMVAPAWDLRLAFSNGLHLWVFATGMSGTPNGGLSWELITPTQHLVVGPGARLVVASAPGGK